MYLTVTQPSAFIFDFKKKLRVKAKKERLILGYEGKYFISIIYYARIIKLHNSFKEIMALIIIFAIR